MVTIRNDIESNGSANRSSDGVASVTDGVKNLSHLANGSRRSTMLDMKSKTFNRTCVGFLAVIVCVGVSFSVGMLFLYGHLVDRLNESAIAGTMWHDKNGNPVKNMPIASTTPLTALASVSTSTTTERHTTPSVPLTKSSTSTIEAYDQSSSADSSSEMYDLDSYPDEVEQPRTTEEAKVHPQKDGKESPSAEGGEADASLEGAEIGKDRANYKSFRYSYEDDDETSGDSVDEGSGNSRGNSEDRE